MTILKFALLLGFLMLGVVAAGLTFTITAPTEEWDYDTYTVCEDGVVCYWYGDGARGGLACIKDEELALKYCG